MDNSVCIALQPMKQIKSFALNRIPGRHFLLTIALSASLGSVAVAQTEGAGSPQTLPTVQLNAGIHNIRAMLAVSTEQRTIGLMFRTEMASNEGMLFVFETPTKQCFWMRNTPLPLSTAFVSDDGTIANIEDMQPQTLDSHCSSKPVRYVLEMNQGWFAKRGIKAGTKISGALFNRQ